MPRCHSGAEGAPRIRTPRLVVAAPYKISERSSTPIPAALPRACEFREQDTAPCLVRVHHFRERKTGPGYPIAVLECGVHRRAFTLYPLGHVPYGRVAWSPVAGDGTLLWEQEDEAPTRAQRALAWRSTLFRAAFAAASGVAWPREGATPCGVWATQLGHLVDAHQILGLSGVDERTGQQIAEALAVPFLVHREAGQPGPDGYRGVGERIVSLLHDVPAAPRLYDRIMRSAVLAGRFRGFVRWDAGHVYPRRQVFRVPSERELRAVM